MPGNRENRYHVGIEGVRAMNYIKKLEEYLFDWDKHGAAQDAAASMLTFLSLLGWVLLW